MQDRRLGACLAASPLPRLEARMLWQAVLGVSRVWLITHDQDPVTEAQYQRFLALEGRRLAGEPMAYLVGSREFYGRVFAVDPAVLIPRPETEFLVAAGLAAIRDQAAPRVLDLGTGSGAVAVTLALERPDADVDATDCSGPALEMARRNARMLGARLGFFQGSWYDAGLGSTLYDLIVSNPPYIRADDGHLHQGDLRFEPRSALTDGADGLQALRTIVQGAGSHLRPNGALCVEHGWDQAVAVRALLAAAGFVQVSSQRDLAGIERITQGRWPA